MMVSKLRTTAVWLLALLGAAIIGFLYFSIRPGASAQEAGGWIAAGFLALRDVISKIEKIVLGRIGDDVSSDPPLTEPTE
jgi:hypothetical protein